MATMKSFFPTTGSDDEWNAAYYRLEDYLRALHVVNKVHQSQIIFRLLQAAAIKHAADPSSSPTALVLEEADAALEGWFAKILPGRSRTDVVGYVALLIADGPEKWPRDFLADDISGEFRNAMQQYEVRAGPDLQVSSMVPRPMDISPLVEGVFKDGGEEAGAGALITAVTAVVALIVMFVFFITR
jgi:hypothetical protein